MQTVNQTGFLRRIANRLYEHRLRQAICEVDRHRQFLRRQA
jgi:hypothetical protein